MFQVMLQSAGGWWGSCAVLCCLRGSACTWSACFRGAMPMLYRWSAREDHGSTKGHALHV